MDTFAFFLMSFLSSNSEVGSVALFHSRGQKYLHIYPTSHLLFLSIKQSVVPSWTQINLPTVYFILFYFFTKMFLPSTLSGGSFSQHILGTHLVITVKGLLIKNQTDQHTKAGLQLQHWVSCT